MKFKIDENLPAELVEDLGAFGHEADTVNDEGLTGAADELILNRAWQEGRVLLTWISELSIFVPLISCHTGELCCFARNPAAEAWFWNS